MANIIIKGKTPIPEGTIGDFPRPFHPDFATTGELMKRKFSGMRNNSLTQRTEIWTVGDKRGEAPTADKVAVGALYCKIFGIDQIGYDSNDG